MADWRKPPLRGVRTLWNHYLVGLYHRIDEHHGFLLAGGMAFAIILSLIPFALIIFAIVGRLVDSGTVQDQINGYIQALIPYEEFAAAVMRFTGERIGEFIAFKGVAGWLGAAGVLVFASGLFSSMKTALNRIYQVPTQKHPLLEILWDLILTLLVVVFVLLSSLALPALEGIKDMTFRRDMPFHWLLEHLRSGAFTALSLATVFLVFLTLYRYVPSATINIRRAAISALWATGLWEIAKQAFGFYLTHVVTLKQIYGAYLFVAVIPLWIYYSSLTFILGAELGQLAHERANTRWARLMAYFSGKRYGPGSGENPK